METGCQQVHAALRRGIALTDPSLAEHLANCLACAELAHGGPGLAQALDASTQADPPGLDAVFQRIDEAVSQERGPRAWLRSRPTPLRGLIGVGLVAVVLVLVAMTWGRIDMAVYPLDRLVLDLAVLLVPAALALVVVLRPLHRPALPRWVDGVVIGAAVLAVLVGPALTVAHQAHPASLLGTGAQFVPRAVVCMITGSVLGLPLLLWMMVSLRRGGRWGLPLRLAGVAAGISGCAGVFLHCPLVSPEHLLAGHATVLVPFLLLGIIASTGGMPTRSTSPSA